MSELQGAMDEANRINEEKDSLMEAKHNIERKIKTAQVHVYMVVAFRD